MPTSQDGFTALMFAARAGHVDCVRLLIDFGADKDATNEVRVGLFSISIFRVV